MIQALLIALWAGICSYDDMGTQILRRPLLTCPLVGIIMGDLQQGLIIGATLELMWMGVGNVGAYSAPDTISGAIIGTALGIASGGGVAAGIALAVPVSLLCQQLLILYKTGICALNHVADRIADTGDFDRFTRINVIPIIIVFLLRAVPCFLAVYFGSGVIESITAALPATIMSGLSVASKLVPAVGMSILMMMMMKKNTWVFLLLGFVLSSYLGLSVLPVALISLVFALLYDMASNRPQKQDTSGIDEEGGYDL